MFLASTVKSLLNATFLICVFMFGMQSATATAQMCQTIVEHKASMTKGCKGSASVNGAFLVGTSNLPCIFWTDSRTVCDGWSKKTDGSFDVNFNGNSVITGNAYCPSGSDMVNGVCACVKGKNWSSANQKCK